jgi:hypothetical protein
MEIMYFQPPVLPKRRNEIMLSHNDNISESVALIHNYFKFILYFHGFDPFSAISL